MDENIFLFVMCISEKNLYEACVAEIEKITIPEGYAIELFPIYDAKSMTEGYNRALSHNAKYKIYLHQDTFILNKNILHELLGLFCTTPQLGLIGMVGCKTIPTSGVWWEGKDLVGKLLDYRNNDYVTYQFRDVQTPFESVESIDGFFMMTQYDVPWREDITGFHFYDASQALEFIQRGYLVGIPKQEKPWTAHINKERTEVYDEREHKRCQQIFLRHYAAFL